MISTFVLFVTDNEYVEKYGPHEASTTTFTTTTTSNTTTTGASQPLVYWWEDSWILNVPGYQSNSIAEMYLASISFALEVSRHRFKVLKGGLCVEERVEALKSAGVDVIVVDTAHAHTEEKRTHTEEERAHTEEERTH